MVTVRKDYVAPTGLRIILVWVSTKMSRLTALAIVSALALMSGCWLHADLKPHCMSTASIPRALRQMAGTIWVGAML